MVNRNYKFEKRQKDLAKQKKKEEKMQRKLTRKNPDDPDGQDGQDGQPDNDPGTGPDEQGPAAGTEES